MTDNASPAGANITAAQAPAGFTELFGSARSGRFAVPLDAKLDSVFAANRVVFVDIEAPLRPLQFTGRLP